VYCRNTSVSAAAVSQLLVALAGPGRNSAVHRVFVCVWLMVGVHCWLESVSLRWHSWMIDPSGSLLHQGACVVGVTLLGGGFRRKRHAGFDGMFVYWQRMPWTFMVLQQEQYRQRSTGTRCQLSSRCSCESIHGGCDCTIHLTFEVSGWSCSAVAWRRRVVVCFWLSRCAFLTPWGCVVQQQAMRG
jgi:hypothetical protein